MAKSIKPNFLKEAIEAPDTPSEGESSSTPEGLIPLDHSQFKDPKGHYRTVSLFVELNRDKKYPSFFSVKNRDYKGHSSLYRLYMEAMDLEEYTFAKKTFGDWDHWIKLSNTYWFVPLITEWRKELQLKLRSEQIQNIRKLARRADAIGLTAARALLALTTPKTRGRPSKEEVQGELKKATEASGETLADAERLGVVVPFNIKEANIA